MYLDPGLRRGDEGPRPFALKNIRVYLCVSVANISMLAAVLCTPAAHAQSTQSYPNRPIRFLVGFAPSGFTDVMARAIAGKLFESWGQQVILDNRLGASTTIAADLTAKIRGGEMGKLVKASGAKAE